jgi:hypothetical protein
MGDLNFDYDRDRDPDRKGYKNVIPIPDDMDRPRMLPPPELTIVSDSGKTTVKKTPIGTEHP